MLKQEDRGHIHRSYNKDVIGILTKKHGRRFTDYRVAWDAAEHNQIVPKTPLYLMLEVDSVCNLKCKMCARAYDAKKVQTHEYMSLDMVDKILNEAESFHLPAILIGTDSECLLHPEIDKIVDKVRSINPVDFFFCTNGTLLTDEKAKLLINGGGWTGLISR